MKIVRAIGEWVGRNSWLSAGIVLIVISALAYLPLLPKLGIYRDDWHIIFGGRLFGPGKFIEMFSIDRPFVGVNFLFLYKLLGERVLYWNISAYGLRVAGGLFFLALIRRVWPKQALAGMLMGALFIVYPGFMQQSNAITYSMHLTYTLMLIFSLFSTVVAFQSTNLSHKIIFTLLAVGSMAYYFLLYEYVIGIEGLRFAILAYLVFQVSAQTRFSKKLLLLLKAWWPYLVVSIALLTWRLFIFQGTRPTVNVDLVVSKYLSAPLYQLGLVVVRTIQDWWEIAFSGWFVPVYNLSMQVRLKQLIFSLGLGAIAAGFLAFIIWAGDQAKTSEVEETGTTKWAKDAIWIGAFGLLISILPVVVSGRDVSFESILTVAFDRYTLHSTPAAIIMFGGILFSVVQEKWRRILPVALVGVAVVTQLNAGAIFANAWEQTRQFWWQMSWRVPQLQPGTMLLAGIDGGQNVVLEEYQVSYPGELIYYPDSSERMLSSAPLLTAIGEKVVIGANDSTYRRTVLINNDYSKTLIAYFPTSTSCLHVLDGRLPIDTSGTAPIIEWLAPYSKIGQIDLDDVLHSPPVEIFGAEPANTWCYHYQRASLAAQAGDWLRVAEIAEQVKQLGQKPRDLSEWIPFLFAHTNIGDYDAAKVEISYVKDQLFIRQQVCKHLDENVDSPLVASPEARKFVLNELCTW